MSRLKKVYIPGPLYRSEVRLVAPSTLKKFSGKGERLCGCYIPSEHIIYLDKTLNRETLVHTFMHEVSHMIDSQTRGLDEEQRADAVATFLIHLFNVESVEQLLGVRL